MLFLRELVKSTPKTHKDYALISEAYKKVEDLCSRINETQRKGDDNRKRLAELFDIGMKIEPELKMLTNSPFRKFVAEDDVRMVDNERKILVERHYFLCSDIIIITKLRRSKKYGQKDMVPLAGGYLVVVSESKVIKDPEDVPLSFEIRYRKMPVSFVFICKSLDAKAAFIDQIRTCFKVLEDVAY